jgi:hypothetical protein
LPRERTARTRRSYDGWGWRWRWGAADVIVNEFQVDTIVVDMFDATATRVIQNSEFHVLCTSPLALRQENAIGSCRSGKGRAWAITLNSRKAHWNC